MLRRIRKGLLSVFAVGALTATLAPACAHNDQSLFIQAVMAPPQNRQNGCVYQPDVNQPKLFTGTLDVGLTDTYRMVVLAGNQLSSKQDINNARAESARIAVFGATVRVQDRAGATLGEFTSPTSSDPINPTTGATPGLGLYSVVGMDPPTVARIRQILGPQGTDTFLVYITLFGQTLGGTDVESNEFQFPVSACNGCLVIFPAETRDPALNRDNCAKSDATQAKTSDLQPCNLGQDESVNCLLCATSRKQICDPFCKVNPGDPSCQ
ncbi:MAG: hypothetical protein KC657_25745 [Myxococcales bacterium]|nr:hypothetical protein [Myxococcales bacterium]